MKKYIGIIAGLAIALSLGLAGAQVGAVSGSVCVEKNAAGVCTRYVNATVGTTQTGAATGVYQTGAYQTGVPAYSQTANVNRQTNQIDLSPIGGLINQVGGIAGLLPRILLTIAVVVFFWFLIRYLIAGKNDPAEKKKAMTNMLYSLAAIFVMVALWGIIAFIGNILDINPNVQVTAPNVPR